MERFAKQQIAFLRRHHVAHLAPLDSGGRPHVVPVCFAYLRGRIYTAVDEKPKRVAPAALRRIRHILADPHVCMVVDHYEEDWTRLAWLQVRGVAVLVTEAPERRLALVALRERYLQYRAMDLESRPLVRITPTQIRWWAAKTPRFT